MNRASSNCKEIILQFSKEAVIDNMPESKKKKKDKRIKSDQRNVMRCDSVTCPELPDALLLEFLTRLPIKKLFQCKCVSRVWCSIIRHSEFAEAYRRQNPGAMLTISIRDEVGGVFLAQQRFYYCILGVEEPQEFVNSFSFSLLDCHGVTQTVNGLVCFHRRGCVFLGNIFTREIKRLPDPPKFGGKVGDQFAVSSSYYLGFDSVNGVYKLLKANSINRIFNGRGSPSCVTCDYNHSYEILTISNRDCSWRKLADGHACEPFLFDTQSPSSLDNGVLYGISTIKYVVVAFIFSTEKFRLIKLPENGPKLFCIRWLGQFWGRLSMFFPLSKCLIIYTLDDHEGHAWTKHEVLLPSELQTEDSNVAILVGSLPSGEILLANPSYSENAFTPVYAYDHRNSNFVRFVVGKWPSALVHLQNQKEGSVLVSCVEQNIAELDTLICPIGGHFK